MNLPKYIDDNIRKLSLVPKTTNKVDAVTVSPSFKDLGKIIIPDLSGLQNLSLADLSSLIIDSSFKIIDLPAAVPPVIQPVPLWDFNIPDLNESLASEVITPAIPMSQEQLNEWLEKIAKGLPLDDGVSGPIYGGLKDIPAAVPPDIFNEKPVSNIENTLTIESIRIPKIIDAPTVRPPDIFQEKQLSYIETKPSIDSISSSPIKNSVPIDVKENYQDTVKIITGIAPITAPVQATVSPSNSDLMATVTNLLKQVTSQKTAVQEPVTNAPVSSHTWIKYLLIGIVAFVIFKLLKK